MNAIQQAIIKELRRQNYEPRTAFDIGKALQIGSRTLYNELRALEDDAVIKSAFLPEPFPRRRVYYLKKDM
jgi:hypothetical protein